LTARPSPTAFAEFGVEAVEHLDVDLADGDTAEGRDDLAVDVALVGVAGGQFQLGGFQPALQSVSWLAVKHPDNTPTTTATSGHETANVLVAEADGNRTRQTGRAGLTGFEAP
jgi:hypothetical protein